MAKQTYKKHLNKKPNKNQTFEKKDDVKIEAITYEEGITVADLAEKLHKNSSEIIKKCDFYSIEFIDKFSGESLSNAIGKNNIKLIGITDDGFKKSLLKKI